MNFEEKLALAIDNYLTMKVKTDEDLSDLVDKLLDKDKRSNFIAEEFVVGFGELAEELHIMASLKRLTWQAQHRGCLDAFRIWLAHQ